MIRPLSNKHITPELVLNAYHQGFFPMAIESGEIGFYAFDTRGLIPLDEGFTVRRSLRQILKKKEYTVTFDAAPRDVLNACSRLGVVPSYELWLSDELIELYMKLFASGSVHTVEVWKESAIEGMQLVGGLYGLVIGAAFCGESMFSRAPYASQIALVHLVERLRNQGFELLDAQMPSEHLKQFGLYECGHTEYMERFHEAATKNVTF